MKKNFIVIAGSDSSEKSTLFSHLAKYYKKKTTLVDKTKPTTNYREFFIKHNNSDYKVIEVPSFKLDADKILQNKINNNTKQLIKYCEFLCWVINFEKINEELSESKPFLVLEKKDKCIILTNTQEKDRQNEFFSLFGVNNIFFLEELEKFFLFLDKKIFFETIIKQKENLPKQKTSTFFVTIIGIPNSGKSTLMNVLLKENRSLVSTKKKTTVEPVFSIYNKNNLSFLIVDTPGVEKIREIEKKIIKKTTLFLVVLDITAPITKQIIKLSNLGLKNDVPSIIIVNKIDLTFNRKIINSVKSELKERLKKNFFSLVLTSLKDRTGITTLLSTIEKIFQQVKKHFNKKELTNLAKQINEQYKEKKIKLYFVVQPKRKEETSIQELIFFFNQPKLIRQSERKNLLQQTKIFLKLKDIPIKIKIKKSG